MASFETGDSDLVDAAGYTDNDFLPMYTFGRVDNVSFSTTSTTWDTTTTFVYQRQQWDHLFPNAVDTAVLSQVRVSPGTDETADVRLHNLDDGETIHEQTGITSQTFVTLGPTDYTPDMTGSDRRLALEIQTDPGNNASELRDGFYALGIRL